MEKEKKIKIQKIIKEIGKKNKKEYKEFLHPDDDSIFTIDEPKDHPKMSTGLLQLDWALNGGLPKGRFTELYGENQSGKSTLAMFIAGTVQKSGGVVGWIDAEHAFDNKWAKTNGVTLEDLPINPISCGEEGLSTTEDLVRTGEFDLIVIDSVAGLIPRAELRGEMGDLNVGQHSRLMAGGLRKLLAITAKSEATILLTNQMRAQIRPGSFVPHGGWPDITTGGRSLDFYASVRIHLRKTQNDIPKNKTGITSRFKIIKNRVGVPNLDGTFNIIYEPYTGIDPTSSLIPLAETLGVVKKSGKWYSWGDKTFNGSQEFTDYISENNLFDKLYKEIEKTSKG